jgi:hypothetical protein
MYTAATRAAARGGWAGNNIKMILPVSMDGVFLKSMMKIADLYGGGIMIQNI